MGCVHYDWRPRKRFESIFLSEKNHSVFKKRGIDREKIRNQLERREHFQVLR